MEEIKESIFPERDVIYASFGARFAAALIDMLVLIIPGFALNYMGLGFVGLIINWIYFALQESGPRQATIGKKAMRIKVVSTNFEKLSFGQATGRYFGKLLSALIVCIGYLMMLWDPRNQTLHDKMAGALVVSSDR